MQGCLFLLWWTRAWVRHVEREVLEACSVLGYSRLPGLCAQESRMQYLRRSSGSNALDTREKSPLSASERGLGYLVQAGGLDCQAILSRFWHYTRLFFANYLSLLGVKSENSRFHGFRHKIFTKFGQEPVCPKAAFCYSLVWEYTLCVPVAEYRPSGGVSRQERSSSLPDSPYIPPW